MLDFRESWHVVEGRAAAPAGFWQPGASYSREYKVSGEPNRRPHAGRSGRETQSTQNLELRSEL